MNTIKKTLLTIAGIAGLSLSAEAQTQNLSQYWLAPQLNTPTAFGSSDYLQVSAHYRRAAIAEDLGFTTSILSAQLPVYSGDRRMGTAGLNLIRETSGQLDLLATTGVMASYSYDVQLSSQHHLLGGIQAGYFSRRLNWDKVTTDTQWQYGQYIGGATGEGFSNERSSLFQANIGLGYYLTDAQGKKKLELGLGANNVNRGRFTYLSEDGNEAEPLRITAYASYKAVDKGSFDLSPMLRWQQEDGLSDYMGGLLLRKSLKEGGSMAVNHLGLGAFYSPEQTTVLALQLSQPSYQLAISYDLATGEGLNQRTRNAVEVSLAWRLNKRKDQKLPQQQVNQPAAAQESEQGVTPLPEEKKQTIEEKKQAKAAAIEKPAPKPLTPEEKQQLKEPVFYEEGSAALSSEAGQQLEAIAEVLKAHPEKKVKIIGHTSAFDNEGAYYPLSEARLRQARAALLELGISPERILEENRAAEQPKATNQTAEGRQKNRRVSFELMD